MPGDLFELQQEIFSKYMERLRRADSTVSDSLLIEEAQRYVSYQQQNLVAQRPHFTGGAVDVTLCDQEALSFPWGRNSTISGLRPQPGTLRR